VSGDNLMNSNADKEELREIALNPGDCSLSNAPENRTWRPDRRMRLITESDPRMVSNKANSSVDGESAAEEITVIQKPGAPEEKPGEIPLYHIVRARFITESDLMNAETHGERAAEPPRTNLPENIDDAQSEAPTRLAARSLNHESEENGENAAHTGPESPALNSGVTPVFIHTGPHAQKAAHDMHARAITLGNHVYAGKDQFTPESARWKGLLAHEITHVGQHNAANDKQKAYTGRWEQEAEYWEQKAESGSDENFLRRGSALFVPVYAPDASPENQARETRGIYQKGGPLSHAAPKTNNTVPGSQSHAAAYASAGSLAHMAGDNAGAASSPIPGGEALAPAAAPLPEAGGESDARSERDIVAEQYKAREEMFGDFTERIKALVRIERERGGIEG
jgi:hypothetical protein